MGPGEFKEGHIQTPSEFKEGVCLSHKGHTHTKKGRNKSNQGLSDLKDSSC